jgi:predicted CoA-binding protein
MDLEKVAKQYLCSGGKVAVVGASTKKERTSYQIVKFLKDRGITVYPVNPSYTGQQIEGLPFYASVKDVKSRVDIVDIVVSPKFQEDVASDLNAMEYKPILWFQPGAENPDLEKKFSEAGFDVVSDACIMVVHDLFCD